MEDRDTRSNAPTPSMDTTVSNGSTFDMDCKTCATHSVPALVESANWKGAVATSTAGVICCLMVRATSLLTMSPTTMPLTPSLGFCSAVTRPIFTTLTISSGRVARANPSQNRQNNSERGRNREEGGGGRQSCQMVLRRHLVGTFALRNNRSCSKENGTARAHRRATDRVPLGGGGGGGGGVSSQDPGEISKCDCHPGQRVHPPEPGEPKRVR